MPRTQTKAAEEPTVHRRKVEHATRRDLTGPDPIIRIGIMEEYDRIEFTVHGSYQMVSLKGEIIEKKMGGDRRWWALPDETEEAHAVYSILTTAFARKDEADKLRKQLSHLNLPLRVAELGEQITIDGRLVSDNAKYRVLIGRWPTPREASKHLNEFKEEFTPRVVRQIIKPATGTLEVACADAKFSFSITEGLRLIPQEDECRITLHDVREGTGFQWEREVDRSYPGVVEIRVDHKGLLMSIVEAPIETYLKGVVPAEMPGSYPLEALKAQAVAARSEVLAKLGMKHPNDPFDLCAHVHCQAYSGCTHYDDRASKAVEDTRGYVLTLDSTVVEAVYSACCGGHTENKLNVWNPPEAPHLKGGWDAEPKAGIPKNMDLTREADVQKWVNMSAPVWCNTAILKNAPPALQRSTDKFRWEVDYGRRELEEIIRRKSGEDIGTLVNIIPLQRGVSGRLMEIEIQGSRRNLTVQRELNIRNVLSLQYLKSACFTLDIEYGEDGTPINFKLKGAGWGHGVGMCQMGAGGMASAGKKFKEILTHYYPGTKVEKVYGSESVSK